jgi:hypothetical protein
MRGRVSRVVLGAIGSLGHHSEMIGIATGTIAAHVIGHQARRDRPYLTLVGVAMGHDAPAIEVDLDIAIPILGIPGDMTRCAEYWAGYLIAGQNGEWTWCAHGGRL